MQKEYGNKDSFDDWVKDPEHERFIRTRALMDQKQIIGITVNELTHLYFGVAQYAWEKFDEARKNAFTTYLNKCLHNKKLELIESRKKPKFLEEWYAPSLDATVEEGGIPEDRLPIGAAETPESILEAKEIKEIAECELAKLSSRDQDIVIKVISGYAQSFVAKSHKITQPAVAAVMKKYRNAVRVALLNAGYSPPGVA